MFKVKELPEMPQDNASPSANGWPARLAAELLRIRTRRGWGAQRVARAAGISRTTLFQLETGRIARPRAKTLFRLARALGVPVDDLLQPVAMPALPAAQEPAGIDGTSLEGSDRFDRQTNPAVTALAQREPALFTGWTAEDWQLLYSTFGTGGALHEEGARHAAVQINRQRETLRRLRILLQTHLAGATASLVDALFDSICQRPGEEQIARGARPGRATLRRGRPAPP